MMKKILKPIILLVCLFSLFSCFDEDMLDPDTDTIEAKPEIISPVAKVNITMGDLLMNNLGEDQTILTENGVFIIQQLQEDIANFKVSDVIDYSSDIPLPPVALNVPAGLPAIPAIIPPGGIELGEAEGNIVLNPSSGQDITLQKIRASFDIDLGINPQPFKYKIEFLFEKNVGVIDNSALNRELVVLRNAVSPVVKFIDEEINFITNDPLRKNILKVIIKITALDDGSIVDLSGFTGFSMNLSLKNPDFGYIQGDFGNLEIDIADDSFDIDMGDMEDLQGKFGFTEPEVKLIIHNRNMGFNYDLNLNLDAIGQDNSVVPISTNPNFSFSITGPKSKIDVDDPMRLDEMVYNSTNSNVVNFIDTYPFKEIKYGGKFTLNPDQGGNSYPDLDNGEFNFITRDAYMQFDAMIKIPLKFRALNGITYKYDIEDVDLGIDADQKEKILSAALLFKSVNGWPVGLKFEEIIFKDQNNIELARMHGGILSPPVVDVDGNVVDGGKEETLKTEITQDVIDILDKVKNIEMLIRLDPGKTQDDKDAPNGVTFSENAKLNLVIGIHAKYDLSLTK